MNKKKITSILYFFNISKAFAYLDPGGGSIILQAIIGTIAAAGATIAFYWRKIKLKFKNLFTKKSEEKENSPGN